MKRMNGNTEKSFLRKIYTVILLLAAILVLLLYLILSGGSERIQKALDQQSKGGDDQTVSPEPQKSDDPAGSTDPSQSADPAESETPQPSADSSPEPADDTADEGSDDDIDSNDSVTKIVSPSRKLDPSYVPADLVEPDVPNIQDDHQQNMLRKDAAKALEVMFAAAADKGYELYLISGYRSYEFQEKLLQYWIELKGEEYALELDTMPGGSEHQLGLAANIGTTDGKCELNVCFADTGAYRWLKENSWKFGYIERYPEGKQGITGITFSPWNFRFVGADAAERIHNSGKTMEEYYGLVS